jgi:hypothetical protein
LARRVWAGRLWIAGSIGYAAFRVWLARQFLADKGLDVWKFAVVELVATVPWAVGSGRAVLAVVDRQRRAAAWWSLLAAAGFFAPDVYVLLATSERPEWLVPALVVWASIAAAVAVRGLVKDVRTRRADQLGRSSL